MSRKRVNQQGFTLVELLLSMTIFTTVMVISTAGFIAMNRSFTRGTVRKQLSEAVQRTTEDITRTLRNMPQNAVAQSEKREGDTWEVLCLAGARYYWPIGDEATGLYRDTNSCTEKVEGVEGRLELVDDRYHVAKLEVTNIRPADTIAKEQLSGALFKVSGTFRIVGQDTIFHDVNDPEKVRCQGGALNSAARTCAVERFSFIINARGSLK